MEKQTRELSENEKSLFKNCNESNYDEVKRLLVEEKVNVDCLDDEGMTPLQNVAYRGNYKMCKLLLDCGADVNAHHHVSRYSTLTFAGLSGQADVVSLLLERGASTTHLNTVNRTAAQMAAFVGNHHVVSIINNFIPKEDIDYFTEVHGLESEPKLAPFLSGPLHKMAIMTNIHPVRLAMYLQTNMLLVENATKVIRVLNLLCEKQFKENNNELLSLKFHHLAFVLTACKNFLNEPKPESQGTSLNKGVFEPLIKRWIKGGNSEGFPIMLEKFLRQSVREYPYISSPLFQQLVHTLAPVNIGSEPSAISILSQAINGQRGIDTTYACSTCGEPNVKNRCSACKYVEYCDKNCQKLHWFTHKTVCSNLAKIYEKEQEDKKNADELDKNLENIKIQENQNKLITENEN